MYYLAINEEIQKKAQKIIFENIGKSEEPFHETLSKVFFKKYLIKII